MTTLEDKIIKKELTPKGFIFHTYEEKIESIVFRSFDYNVYDFKADDLIFRKVETPTGYHFDTYDSERGEVLFLKNKTDTTNTSAVFHTDDQARASLALALLSRQLARVNGDWKPDWNNGIAVKSFISQVGEGGFEIDWGYYNYHFLSFRRRDEAERFLEANIDLIKQAAIFL